MAVGQRPAVTPTSGALARDPARLMFVAPQNYRDWDAQQQVFESMAAVASGWLTLRLPGVAPESLVPQRVTADFFKVLRVSPALGGRSPSTTRPRAPIAWRCSAMRCGAAVSRPSAIVGRVIPLELLEGGRGADEAGYEVIGVMPPDFTYPVGAARPTDIWIPYVVPERDRLRDPTGMATYLQVIARLKPDVPLTQAQAQMDQIAAALERAHPVWNKDSRIGVRPLVDHFVGAQIKSWLFMLLAAVVMLLLIACANIASLLLARAIVRQRDLAVRAALGASWWRLGTPAARREPRALRRRRRIRCHPRVVGRRHPSRGDARRRSQGYHDRARPQGAGHSRGRLGRHRFVQWHWPGSAGGTTGFSSRAMRDTGRSGDSPLRQRLRNALVVAEVSLAVVLLVGAALFIGSFVALLRIDPGFDTTNVLTAQITPRVASVSAPADRTAALAEVVDRVGTVPGVEHAALLPRAAAAHRRHPVEELSAA